MTAKRFVIAAGSRPAVPPIPGLDRVPHLDQRHAVRSGRTAGPSADPRRRPDRPGNGRRLRRPWLPRHRHRGGHDRRQGRSRTGRRSARRADRRAASRCSKARGNRGRTRTGPGPGRWPADRRQPLAGRGRPARPTSTRSICRPATCGPRAGIATDRGLRSLTNRRVFAVGDIADPQGIGPRAFTHVGSYHAGIVIRRALFRLPARVDYAALPRVTYTNPELAQAGMTEAEASAAGHASPSCAGRWRTTTARSPNATRRPGETGRLRQPGYRRRHPGAECRRDDRPMGAGHRPAREAPRWRG